jgi:hypothetical protein
MAVAGNWGNAPLITIETYNKRDALMNYCKSIGWECRELVINEDDLIDNDKLGLLKLLPAGEVLHGVGMKFTESTFYVMHEPKV